MTTIPTTRTKANEKATELHERTTQRINTIRANADLSAEKKTKMIAKAFIDLKSGLDAAAAERDASTTASRSTLERKLYGLPDRADASAMISYRDALDRAAQLDPADETAAAALLSRATTSGDDLLARAILATAYERQQVEVINQYSAANPAAYNDVEELWSIQTSSTSFAEGLHFYAPKPAELDRYSDYAITDLASTEEG